MNNSELIASVAQQAGINSTVLQQYITQLQQFQIQRQNVAGLANFDLQTEAARIAKEEARYVLAKKKSDDLAKSAAKTSDIMNADMQSMRANGVTPSQYYGNAAKAAGEGNVYWKKAMNDSVSSMDDLSQKSRDHQDYMAKNPDITGNVQGIRSIDADLIRMDGSLVDMHKDFKQTLIIQQKNEAENAADTGRTARLSSEMAAQREVNSSEFKRQMSKPK